MNVAGIMRWSAVVIGCSTYGYETSKQSKECIIKLSRRPFQPSGPYLNPPEDPVKRHLPRADGVQIEHDGYLCDSGLQGRLVR